MQDEMLIPENVYQYMVELFNTRTTYDVHELLMYSKLYDEPYYLIRDTSILHIVIHPDIYKKYQNMLHQLAGAIKAKYVGLTHKKINSVKTYSDLSKFTILRNNYTPVLTPWEEINRSQDHLIQLFRIAKADVHYQNIGNAARSLLEKLADIVFNPTIHIPTKDGLDVSKGRYKNRLHTFIRHELSGAKNEEFRKYVLSLIESTENGVDLANKLTHDLNADALVAESCVIGTISTVNLVKSVFEFSIKSKHG